MAVQGFAPLIAGTDKEVQLAMQRLWLTGQVLPVGARLVVEHVFQSGERQPVEVIYAFALPKDAALRSFRVSGDGFEVHSELKETAKAVEAYEKGMADGSLSTLARQYGDGVVNLTIGNLRPDEIVTVHLDIMAGVESRDDGFRFRFPFALAPAYHPRARVREVSPGVGEMELPPDEFGDVILPPYHRDAKNLHEVGFDLGISVDELSEAGSPSHPVRVRNAGGGARVSLAKHADVPDRDLVLDVRCGEPRPLVLAGAGKDGRKRFAALIPSTSFGVNPENPRRVVVVLDRSGSMGGAPIQQAKRAIEACLGALSPSDYFGLVAFDDRTETFEPRLASGTKDNRDRARRFLERVDARGGTELAAGFLEAARLLAGGGDVLILTDGQVAGTEKILAQARITGIRIHCLGIGSASQDRFLSLLARETGGVSRFLTAQERVDLPAVDLFASIGRPVASGIRADGVALRPAPPECVFAGTPLLLFGEGDGRFRLRWDGGLLEVRPPREEAAGVGETIRLLQGARLITDLESRDASPAEIREVSAAYGLASREMSLVAVIARAGDRAGSMPKTIVVPVGMPQHTQFDAYFGAPQAMGTMASLMAPMAPPPPSPMPLTSQMPGSSGGGLFRALFSKKRSAPQKAEMAAPPPDTAEDKLLALASSMEADGGMPGGNQDERVLASIVALLAFLASGHTPKRGAFRSHVARLVAYLEKAPGTAARKAVEWARAVDAGTKAAPGAEWVDRAARPSKWRREVDAIA